MNYKSISRNPRPPLVDGVKHKATLIQGDGLEEREMNDNIIEGKERSPPVHINE